jgi:hypothetical protein
MKNTLIYSILFLLILFSCEKSGDEVFFRIGNDTEYRFSDIELYDTSSHMIYFRNAQSEFNDFKGGTFTFMNNEEAIYTGSFVPGFSSSFPSGPFIMKPSMYGDYALRIENWRSEKPDIRNDARIIDALNEHGLLHSGLSISSGSVQISGAALTFRFTVKNCDRSDLLIIDPVKTGTNLFHYFTNGLYIYDADNKEIFSGKVPPQIPDPWNSWKTDWLSELRSGESREFTISYTIDKAIINGKYIINFSFPGLSYQVKKDQLYQGRRRVWLGGIQYKSTLIIQ